MSKKVTLIYGDGIGPEVIGAAAHVIEGAGVTIDWELRTAGIEALEKYGKPLPTQVITSIKKNKVALKGPLTTAVAEGLGAYSERVEKIDEIVPAIRRGIEVTQTGRPAVLEMMTREETEFSK